MIATGSILFWLGMTLPLPSVLDGVDDPGIARRVEGWPKPEPALPPELATANSPPANHPAEATLPSPVPAGPAPASSSSPPPLVVEAPRPSCETGAAPAPASTAVPLEERRGPGVMLSYRQFGFVRLGAADPSHAGAMPQTFHVLSLELIPVSWLVRINLAPEFGWAEGGDYFAAMTGGVGLQWPAFITPFAEVTAGGGYMRREQFGITVPTAIVRFGVDAGVAIRIARHLWTGASLGYIHPVNWFLKETVATGVYTDSFTFKLSVGF